MAKARKGSTIAVFIGIRANVADTFAASFDDSVTFPRSAWTGKRAEFDGTPEEYNEQAKAIRAEVSEQTRAVMAHVNSAIAGGAAATVFVDTLSLGVRDNSGGWEQWPTVHDADDVRQFGAILRAMGAKVIHGSF